MLPRGTHNEILTENLLKRPLYEKATAAVSAGTGEVVIEVDEGKLFLLKKIVVDPASTTKVTGVYVDGYSVNLSDNDGVTVSVNDTETAFGALLEAKDTIKATVSAGANDTETFLEVYGLVASRG